jgi:hypothetical protein
MLPLLHITANVIRCASYNVIFLLILRVINTVGTGVLDGPKVNGLLFVTNATDNETN